MAAVRHFEFVGNILGRSTKVFGGGLYHCAKFGWNRFSRFDCSLSLNIFCASGLKAPMPAPLGLFLG